MARYITHYQLSKLVNFRLGQEGLKGVTSQQIYGALRNKPMFDLDSSDTLEWIERYVEGRKTGKRNSAESVDPEEFFRQARAEATEPVDSDS
jgi:hypothetical protein